MKVVPLGGLPQGSSAQERDAAVEARLRRRVDALGIIIAGAAHEFNNVVMAVQAGARMARKRADRPGEVDRIAGMMEAAADRGAHLTASLLAFARRDEAQTHIFAVCGSLKAIAELLDQTLGLAIEVDCPKELPAARGDQGEFETVLVNLIITLRKPTARDGALRITVSEDRQASSDQRLRLLPGGYLRVAVVLAKVAEPLRDAEGRTEGLDVLASAGQAFAERSGGAAQVDCDLAGGTTVTLWLATAQTNRAEPAATV